jgi:hypothetical protein
MAIRHREEVLNTTLAGVLQNHGIEAEPETISAGRKGMPDVLFVFRGLRCVIEGKYDDVANYRDVVSGDAQKRLDNGTAQLAIAVVYKRDLRTVSFANLPSQLQSAEYEFRIFTEAGPQEWSEGPIDLVLAGLRHAQEDLARDDAVQRLAASLSERLVSISTLLADNEVLCDRLTISLGISHDATETPATAQRRRATAAKVAALTIANALIFQEQLSSADGRVSPLRAMLTSTDLASKVGTHWDWICININYVPIFRIAANTLLSLPANPTTTEAVRTLLDEAIQICSNRAALRHDLVGRIYHWLLHDAKYLGTYYTAVPSATLLLQVALAPARWPSVDFSDFAQLSEFRVADPACGTGTLLMATSQALTDNFVRSRVAATLPLDDAAFRTLHQALMENVLHGYDVLASAIQLTASTLAMLAPEVSFRRMRLYTMPMGRMDDGSVRLGSLDYFESARLQIQLTIDGGLNTSASVVTGEGNLASVAPFPRLDLCVMNPPFVRSVNKNLLFGSVPDARGAMQTELKRLVVDSKVSASIVAGLGSVFIALADRYLNDEGRLALVIPAAICTGDAWQKTRKLIFSNFHLELVVASHDPSKWSFSENTDLSEVMVVAKKKSLVEHSSTCAPALFTSFLNLTRNVKTSGEALAVAHALNMVTSIAALGTPSNPTHSVTEIKVGGQRFGELVTIPAGECANQWIGCAFAQTDVLRAAAYLRQGYLIYPGSIKTFKLPIVSLGTFATFGPDGRDIHDGFSITDAKTMYPALWGTDGDRIRVMRQAPNKWLTPKQTAAKGRSLRDISLLWPRAGRLMISTRLRLTTQRLTAVLLDVPALSNIWSPVSIEGASDNHLKALTVWLNSSLGIMLVLFGRVPTEGPWIQFKKPNLRELGVLDVLALGDSVLTSLSAAYDSLCMIPFDAFSDISSDFTRESADAAVQAAFGLPSLVHFRKSLGDEPMVSDRVIPTSASSVDDSQLELFSLV